MEKTQTIIWLLRHGETDFLYSEDPLKDARRVLSDNGKIQVEKVGRYLANYNITDIYSSPLERCQQSAEIIAKIVGLEGEAQTAPELAEEYPDLDPDLLAKKGKEFLQSLAVRHAGGQLVAVTHQFLISRLVRDFFAGSNPYHTPPKPADLFRFVYADARLVEVTRLQPARV